MEAEPEEQGGLPDEQHRPGHREHDLVDRARHDRMRRPSGQDHLPMAHIPPILTEHSARWSYSGLVPAVELEYFPDCPNWRSADERVRLVAERHGLTVEYRIVDSIEQAELLGFRGSPTILVDGRDPFVTGDEPSGLSCRLFATPEGRAGSPTIEQLERAFVR